MKDLTKLKIVFFLKFCAEAMFIPFLALYYKSLGFNEAIIGVFLAIPPIVGITLTPIYSIICKNVKITKMVFSFISIIELLCMYLFFKLTSFYNLLFVAILFNVFHANNFGLVEAFSSVCANNNNTDYSKIRVYGSFAYVIGLTLSGFITRIGSFFIATVISMVLTVIAIIFSFYLKVDTKESSIEKRNVKNLLKNKNFYLFVIFFMIYVGSMNVGDDFFSTYLKETKGISNDIFGYIWASFILVEALVIIFLYSMKKKIKFRHLYMIAIILSILRFFISALGAPLPLIIIFGLTRGITWGIHAYLFGQYIVYITGKSNGGLAIMISSMVINIYQASLKVLLGKLIDLTSYYIFYLLLSYLLIFSFIFFFVVYKKNEYANNNETLNEIK